MIAFAMGFMIISEAHKGHGNSEAGGSSVKMQQPAGHDTSAVAADSPPVATAQHTGSNEPEPMGLEEKLGAMIPLDLKCADQRGDSLTLRQCMKGPTLFTMLYYRCTDACGLLLSGVANALRPLADNPAAAPNFIALSIGEREGPADAAKAQSVADQILRKPYPADRWHFLTASPEVVRKVAAASGFHFVKKGDDYDHPLLLMVLSPEGKITRYITGTDFLSADITLSLMEARTGTIQPTIARIVRACFSVDPKGRRLVFKTLQVSATVILSLLGAFVLFLVLKSRNQRRKGAKR
jgi:protein SCO1/2